MKRMLCGAVLSSALVCWLIAGASDVDATVVKPKCHPRKLECHRNDHVKEQCRKDQDRDKHCKKDNERGDKDKHCKKGEIVNNDKLCKKNDRDKDCKKGEHSDKNPKDCVKGGSNSNNNSNANVNVNSNTNSNSNANTLNNKSSNKVSSNNSQSSQNTAGGAVVNLNLDQPKHGDHKGDHKNKDKDDKRHVRDGDGGGLPWGGWGGGVVEVRKPDPELIVVKVVPEDGDMSNWWLQVQSFNAVTKRLIDQKQHIWLMNPNNINDAPRINAGSKIYVRLTKLKCGCEYMEYYGGKWYYRHNACEAKHAN